VVRGNRRTIILVALALFSAVVIAPAASADVSGQQVRTQSGKVHCEVWANYWGMSGPEKKATIPAGSIAMCAPSILPDAFPGDPNWPGWAGLAVVDSAGNFSIQPIELPSQAAKQVVMSYGQTYRFNGWSIAAGQDGTRFTNDRTGHGMFVNYETVYAF